MFHKPVAVQQERRNKHMMKPVSCRGFQKGFQGVSNFPRGFHLGVSGGFKFFS